MARNRRLPRATHMLAGGGEHRPPDEHAVGPGSGIGTSIMIRRHGRTSGMAFESKFLPRSRKSFEKGAKPHAKELRVLYEMIGADALDATLMRLHSVDGQAYAVSEHFSAETQLASQEVQPSAYVHINATRNTTRFRKPSAPVPAPTYAAA